MFVIFLILAVIFVNGWTDAPNAITSIVCSKTLSMGKSVILAAVCNFLGMIISFEINSDVAENIHAISTDNSTALCAAMVSVILLAVGAWVFGIPTSESHAIIASLSGASVACGGSIAGRVIIFAIVGLILSVGIGFILGYIILYLLLKKSISAKNLRYAQIVGAIVMSLMHGAQDGQKFIGIFIAAAGFELDYIPIWSILLCAATMATGTACGGGRIINNVGKRMVKLDLKKGVATDIAGGLSLFLSTILGMPVSTTHAKTSAVIGCGYYKGGIEKHAVRQMLTAWVITFPICFVLGYGITKVLSNFL